MTAVPKVSVVIPAFNEGTYIDRLLEALVNQNFKHFEVIVSDAQSKDETGEVIKSFNSRLDIKLISSPPKGPAHGRNVGAARARGEWLLFLDADVDIADPDFINTLLSQTTKHSWNTSTAKMTARGRAAVLYSALLYYQKLLAKTNRPIASGYCIFTKNSVFKAVGGFNEKIHFGEDYEYVSKTGINNKFGFVNATYYYVDPRRNDSDGLRLAYKGTLNEIYRLFSGYKKLEKNPIIYEFGKHKRRGD